MTSESFVGKRPLTGLKIRKSGLQVAPGQGYEFCGDLAAQIAEDEVVGGHEGFCVLEVFFDAAQRPTDYRFIDVNPVFEQLTGLHDALGKTMRELAPAHEQHWFETFGRVAQTGEPTRFTSSAQKSTWSPK